VEYLHAGPHNDFRHEYLWPLDLTNRQLTVTKIARALWQADLYNDRREGLTHLAYLPAMAVNYIIDGRAQTSKSWSVLAGDEEDSDSYDEVLPPLEEILQLVTEETIKPMHPAKNELLQVIRTITIEGTLHARSKTGVRLACQMHATHHSYYLFMIFLSRSRNVGHTLIID